MDCRIRTFREFAAIELTGFELHGDNVSQRFVKELDGDTEACGRHDYRESWDEGWVVVVASRKRLPLAVWARDTILTGEPAENWERVWLVPIETTARTLMVCGAHPEIYHYQPVL